MSALPAAYPVDGLLAFGHALEAHSPMAAAMEIEFPPLESAALETLNRLDDSLRSLLCGLSEESRIQFRWSVNGDYSSMLERYRKRSPLESDSRLTPFVRGERYRRHLRQQEESMLRRERLVVYAANNGIHDLAGDTASLDLVLHQQRDNLHTLLQSLISEWREQPHRFFEDEDHFREWYCQLNPTCTRSAIDPFWEESFDPESSLQWLSEEGDYPMTKRRGEIVFTVDGHYQGLLVLREWPALLHPGDIRRLTGGGIPYLSIVQNIRPLSAREEMDQEILAIRRLRRELEEKESGFLHRVEIERRQDKLEALQEGRVKPFRVLTVLRTWSPTMDMLSAQMQTLRTALDGWGARYYRVQQAAQAQNLFLETLPGNLFSGYRGYDLYSTSDFLPSILPASSSYVGTGNTVNEGDVLLEGAEHNLCTLNLFIGDTPQNAVVIGTRGSGKSVLLDEVLAQTADHFDFLCIVEEGLSHGVLVQALGGQPLVITPESGYCINYLDTRGLPLTPGHLSFCHAILQKMAEVGGLANPDSGPVESLRDLLQALYWDYYRNWVNGHPELLSELESVTFSVYRYQREKISEGMELPESFLSIRRLREESPEEYEIFLDRENPQERAAYLASSEGELALRNTAYAFMTAEEYPTHRNLVDLVAYLPGKSGDVEAASGLADALRAWTCDEGAYGSLLDGVTNLPLDEKILHFELGRIPDSAVGLKDLVAFILTSTLRREVLRRPRSQRKGVIIEEAARFREIPQGDKIMAELYAQMRKFNCWVLIVLQQYAQIRESALKSVIFGNSNQLWLLRNNDREDLEDIARFNDLPDRVVETILRFPLPEQQPESERASSFFCWDKARLNGGVVRVRPCPEVLYIASSGGEHFEKRRIALSKYTDVWTGVKAECQSPKNSTERKEWTTP